MSFTFLAGVEAASLCLSMSRATVPNIVAGLSRFVPWLMASEQPLKR
jgi:hypothetical protein